MKKLTLAALCFFSIAANAQKPFVVPEIKEWRAGSGVFTMKEHTRIFGPERIEKCFADDCATMFGTHIDPTDAKKDADIVLRIEKDESLGTEGYTIEIGKKITVTAPTDTGLFWATRTLLQMREQSPNLPQGTIRDWPDYPLRGFMLDCGRKFFPISFLKDYVKFMAYYKMNAFQIHLNDNGFPKYFNDDWAQTQAAFRLESDVYPGLAARDGFYTKDEFRELQRLAEANCVEIIPEIDVPAHSLAFTKYRPELAAEGYNPDHLDLFKPAVYEFLDALFAEYCGGGDPVFRGKRVHIGTDEYSNKDPRVVEKFRHFTDYYIRYVEKFGKQACVWGALTHAAGTTPVKHENVLMWVWNNGFAQPEAMMERGFRVVSIPDGLLYIVPKAGYYYDFLNHKHLYETWTPAVIGDKRFAERDPRIEGGMFAVWNDVPNNGVGLPEVHERVLPAMRTLAAKMWTGVSVTVPYDEFAAKAAALHESPDGKVRTNLQV